MHDIICPHCKKAFKVDETGYAEILKQVRDTEFEQQIHQRLELAEKEKLKEVELAKSHLRNELLDASATKDAEIKELKGKIGSGFVEDFLSIS